MRQCPLPHGLCQGGKVTTIGSYAFYDTELTRASTISRRRLRLWTSEREEKHILSSCIWYIVLFSYIITRVAPHCVNTLRILHAALSLSLSLSLEPAQSSNIPYCPHCGPPCNPATVPCNPWRVTFLHFSTLRFCTSRRLLVDWSLIVANLDRRPARTHQRAPCTPPCCLANATPPLTTP